MKIHQQKTSWQHYQEKKKQVTVVNFVPKLSFWDEDIRQWFETMQGWKQNTLHEAILKSLGMSQNNEGMNAEVEVQRLEANTEATEGENMAL